MCGCKKNLNRNRNLTPKGVIKPGVTPAQMRSASLLPSNNSLNSNGMSAEKRKTQAIRREQIKKALENRGKTN